MWPLVSVVIPAYNRENTVLRAVNSVLAQTYSNIEVIVVDDCSTDKTVEIVRNCKDSRLRLVCLPYNQGANVARNIGIERAKGEFIAFQDSDDEWLEDKLEKQVAHMLDNNLMASFSPYIMHDGTRSWVVPNDYLDKELYDCNLSKTLKKRSCVGTPTLVIRKEVVSHIGMFDEKMRRLQDYEFVIRLVKNFRCGYICEPLVNAYKLGGSISSDNGALLDAYVRLLEKHGDFMDVESIVVTCLEAGIFFEGTELNWEKFNKLVTAAENGDPGMETKCCRTIIQTLYKKYYPVKGILNSWYQCFREYIKNGEYAVYGAGVYGRIVYQTMKQDNYIPKCFLVTKMDGISEIDGIPVMELSEQTDREMPVMIAVSWEKQTELIKNLMDREMYKFCIFPFY